MRLVEHVPTDHIKQPSAMRREDAEQPESASRKACSRAQPAVQHHFFCLSVRPPTCRWRHPRPRQAHAAGKDRHRNTVKGGRAGAAASLQLYGEASGPLGTPTQRQKLAIPCAINTPKTMGHKVGRYRRCRWEAQRCSWCDTTSKYMLTSTSGFKPFQTEHHKHPRHSARVSHPPR